MSSKDNTSTKEYNMSEVILKFKKPEEQYELDMALNGDLYHTIIFNLDNKCRGWVKHGHSFKSIEEALWAVRDEISESGFWTKEY